MADPVNMALLQRATRGNTDKIRLLLSLYLKQNAQTLAKLKEALEAADAEKVRQAAHAMAGSSGFLGASDLSLPLVALEEMGETGQLTPGGPGLVAQVEIEFNRVQSFFNSL